MSKNNSFKNMSICILLIYIKWIRNISSLKIKKINNLLWINLSLHTKTYILWIDPNLLELICWISSNSSLELSNILLLLPLNEWWYLSKHISRWSSYDTWYILKLLSRGNWGTLTWNKSVSQASAHNWYACMLTHPILVH
jgi:hypothetical protein